MREERHNPYLSPTANLEEDAYFEAYHTEPFYSWRGRVGRIRYLSYTMLLYCAFVLIIIFLGIVIGVLGGSGGEDFGFASSVLVAITLIGQLYAYFVPIIRRLNDINRTGWLSLIMLIPIANIILWLYLVFARGDEGSNDYGAPATPPTILHYILGLILPIIAILLILGIAIPAYQEYLIRAQIDAALLNP